MIKRRAALRSCDSTLGALAPGASTLAYVRWLMALPRRV
jgi:hypothetical protein